MINKKHIKFTAKVIVSIVFITVLLLNSDIKQVYNQLRSINIFYFIICIILYLFGQIVSAYKWKLLSEAIGFKNKLKNYIDFYFIGMYFNLFLPTTIGGDVAKGYYLSKSDEKKRKSPALYTILAERFTGVVIIIWMATITVFLPTGSTVPLSFKLLMTLLTCMVLFLTPIFPIFMEKTMGHKNLIKKILDDTNVYWKSPKLIFRALIWSFVFHAIIIFIHILIGLALGLKIPVLYYLIVYPMTAIVGFIPVAFNGIGPREATYIYFLKLIGINSSSALAFSILWFAIVLVSSSFGGIFYLKRKQEKLPTEKELQEKNEVLNINELIDIK